MCFSTYQWYLREDFEECDKIVSIAQINKQIHDQLIELHNADKYELIVTYCNNS